MTETFPEYSPFLLEDTRKTRWAIPYHHESLNARVENLIVNNGKAIQGKNLLDLGCHFGTFAYASLLHGARHVHGIDAEDKLIQSARRLFGGEGVSGEKYYFSCGEILDFLANQPDDSYDTVLCLGVFYYLNDPFHALREMLRVAKRYIIMDTFTAYYGVCMSREGEEIYRHTKAETFDLPLVLYPQTQALKKDYSLPSFILKKKKEIGMLSLPTERALEYFFEMLKCRHRRIRWDKYVVNKRTWQEFIDADVKKLSHWADLYHTGIRVSYILEKI